MRSVVTLGIFAFAMTVFGQRAAACNGPGDCPGDEQCDLATQTCYACTETDNGVDYYTRGTTSGVNINGVYVELEDFCRFDGKIAEFYCTPSGSFNPGLAYPRYTSCPVDYECYDGECRLPCVGFADCPADMPYCVDGYCSEPETCGYVNPGVPGSTYQFILYDGANFRAYDVYVPPSYVGDPTPVVFNFHGLTMGWTEWQYEAKEKQAIISRMNDKADSEGFITVHPNGIYLAPPPGENGFNLRGWDAGGGCCGWAHDGWPYDIDDVEFTRMMIESLVTSFCVDPDRVYAAGMSNGGFMSSRLACELSESIAAIAVVSGGKSVSVCAPSRPVPALFFHGTGDGTVPFDGSDAGTDLWPAFDAIEDTAADFAAMNNCTQGPDPSYSNGDAGCEEYSSCDEDANVELCTIYGGDHCWPGGDMSVSIFISDCSAGVTATDYLWDFFVSHPMP